MKRLFLAALVAAVSGALALPVFGEEGAPLRTVLSCPLAGGDNATLKAIAHGLKGAEGDDLFVETGGKTERAFLDMPDTDFRGRIVLASCIHNTLIFAINYGPPYLKGVAIRGNPKSHAIERLYFSEKALPRWLFEDEKRMLVIVPNIGYETDKRYLVYEYVSGKGQSDASTPVNKLPKPMRQLIQIH
ncbi:conserved hypothetical protein [Burkholderia sp. H160]|nr:conserved hypothetical protein [Burkholderia sp. H160]